MSESVSSLMNIGPKSATLLATVGIHTRADLEDLGAVMAYLMVKHHHPEANLLLLHALYGALHDVHWASLEPDVKAQLAAEASAPFSVSMEPRR